MPSAYTVSVTVHCAINLPCVQPDVLPSPFVTCKTTTDARLKRPAKAATYALANSR
jgi:hypothetical protein